MFALQLFGWTSVWFCLCKITLQDLNVPRKPSAFTLKARAQHDVFLGKNLGKELSQAPSHIRRRSVDVVAHVPIDVISSVKDFKHTPQPTTWFGKPATLDKGKEIMLDTDESLEPEPSVYFSEEENEFYQSEDIIQLIKAQKADEFRTEHLKFSNEEALLEHYAPIWKESGLDIDKMKLFSKLIGLGKRAPLTRKGIEAEWHDLFFETEPISSRSPKITRDWDDYEAWFMNELGEGEKILRDWVRYAVLKRDPTWDVWWTDEQLGRWLSSSDKTEWYRQLIKGDQKRYLPDAESQLAAAETDDKASQSDLNTPEIYTRARGIDIRTTKIDTQGLSRLDKPAKFNFFTWRFQQKAEIFFTKGGPSKWWRQKLWKKLRLFHRKEKKSSRST